MRRDPHWDFAGSCVGRSTDFSVVLLPENFLMLGCQFSGPLERGGFGGFYFVFSFVESLPSLACSLGYRKEAKENQGAQCPDPEPVCFLPTLQTFKLYLVRWIGKSTSTSLIAGRRCKKAVALRFLLLELNQMIGKDVYILGKRLNWVLVVSNLAPHQNYWEDIVKTDS